MRTTLLVMALLGAVAPPNHAQTFKPEATAGYTRTFMTGEAPYSTNNDDTCDIAQLPAATLLLPYFEVDFAAPSQDAVTTLFSLTNVSPQPQIARVTIWTDLSYPVLTFNLFLTGYDVTAINLYDVLARGIIAPPSGTSSFSTPGSRSLPNDANPNFTAASAALCSILPGAIPPAVLADAQAALTFGRSSSCGQTRIGLAHVRAIGYATIDVVGTCNSTFPADPAYFTSSLLFDNVLTGDYQHVAANVTTGNFAQGNPLVHIRAVPEGGAVGSVKATNLPYTFYDRYTAALAAPANRTFDRRQPLPSTFAARWIESPAGFQSFKTDLKIWREAVTGPSASCTSYSANVGTAMRVIDMVRFDEHENPTTLGGGVIICCPNLTAVLPPTSRTSTSSAVFPYQSQAAGDVAGWIYLNLNNGGSNAYSVTESGVSYTSTSPPTRNFKTGTSTTVGQRQSQNWISVSLSAESRYAVEYDATPLANGCTPAPAVTTSPTAMTPIPIAPPAGPTP